MDIKELKEIAEELEIDMPKDVKKGRNCCRIELYKEQTSEK